MRRIFHHYEKWEDWKDGLYRRSVGDAADEILISRSARLLSDIAMLDRAMTAVVDEWKHSAEVNLSNRSRNRRAWLGQSACCLVCGTPEHLTKQAWHRLSPAEQERANAVADSAIEYWEQGCQSVN